MASSRSAWRLQTKGARYQGVVPLASGGLAACLEAYFRDSEQLPTRIWLAANSRSAAGLLLQRLPERSSKPSLVMFDEEDPAKPGTASISSRAP